MIDTRVPCFCDLFTYEVFAYSGSKRGVLLPFPESLSPSLPHVPQTKNGFCFVQDSGSFSTKNLSSYNHCSSVHRCMFPGFAASSKHRLSAPNGILENGYPTFQLFPTQKLDRVILEGNEIGFPITNQMNITLIKKKEGKDMTEKNCHADRSLLWIPVVNYGFTTTTTYSGIPIDTCTLCQRHALEIFKQIVLYDAILLQKVLQQLSICSPK